MNLLELKSKSVPRFTFYLTIFKEERLRNIGVTTEYDTESGFTVWLVGGSKVGLSRGKLGQSNDYYTIEG